jgi:hypothetical protein
MSLEAVHEEDRPIIRNVVAAIQVLKKDKIFTSWNVSLDGPRYLVTTFVVENVDFEFSARELDMIHDVSQLRVLSVSSGRHANRGNFLVAFAFGL